MHSQVELCYILQKEALENMSKSSVEKNDLKKGPWTAEEDQKLVDYIQKHGHGRWRTLPKHAGLKRCGKSCRLRWTNYLRPDIKRGKLSIEEEETIIQLHSAMGNKWSAIAARLPGRTDNEIKNYWNTHIRKKLLRMGIDPVTHAPRLDLLEHSASLLIPPHQFDLQSLLSIRSLLNPDILSLATTLFSCQDNIKTQEMVHSVPNPQQNHFPIPFLSQAPNSSSILPNLGHDNGHQAPYNSANYGYDAPIRQEVINAMSQNGAFVGNNLEFGSPLSSTLASSSSIAIMNSSGMTQLNGCSTSVEDECSKTCVGNGVKDKPNESDRYSSKMLMFDFPISGLMDVNGLA